MTVVSLMMMDADISASARLFKGLLGHFHGRLLLVLAVGLGILDWLELVHGDVISVPCGCCLLLDSRWRGFNLWKPRRLNDHLVHVLILLIIAYGTICALLVYRGLARDAPIRKWVLHEPFRFSGRAIFAWLRKWGVTLLAAVTPSLGVRNCY